MRIVQGLVLCLLGLGALGALGVGGRDASAEPAAPAVAVAGARSPAVAVVVPVIGDGGRPAYCTRNLAPAAAAPLAGGGYRVALGPGRYTVRFTMTDHRVDVLVTVPASGDVVVPPVVVRGSCHEVEVRGRASGRASTSGGGGWALRFGRIYKPTYGVHPDAVPTLRAPR